MASARPYIVTLYLEEPSNAILKIRLLTFYSEPLQQTHFFSIPLQERPWIKSQH